MAIETIRDLAFKISMNIEMNKLHKADQAVDKFKSKVISLQRSVGSSVDYINNKFSNVNTFKAQKRINDVTKALQNMKATKPDLNNLEKTNSIPKSLNIEKIKPVSEKLEKIPSIFERINNRLGGTKLGLEATKFFLGKILKITTLVAGAMKLWKYGVDTFNKSLDKYREYMVGLVRVQTYFANDFQYRQQMLGESLVPGAKTFKDFQKGSRDMANEALANARKVANEGIIGFNNLQMMIGQLASFQIDLKAWFGGEQGIKHIEYLADLMAAIQMKGGSVDEALRVANMIGKADAMGLFGQLQRWGIVLTDHQKKIIKTGNEYEKLSALMQGLKQNVGNLNSEMSKTPLGYNSSLTNKIGESLTNLGKHTIFFKNALLEMKLAFMPITNFLVRTFSAVFGILTKLTTATMNFFNWLFINTAETKNWVKILKMSLIGLGTAVAIAFFPVTATIGTITAIILLIEDIWTAMNGGKSVISYVLAPFIEKIKKIKNVLGEIPNYVDDRLGKIGAEFSVLGEDIKNVFIKIKDDIKNMFSELFETLTSFFSNIIDSIASKFNFLSNKIKSFWGWWKGSDKEQDESDFIPTFNTVKDFNVDDLLNRTSVSNENSGLNYESMNNTTNNNNSDSRAINFQNGAITLNITTTGDIDRNMLEQWIEDSLNKSITQNSVAFNRGGF